MRRWLRREWFGPALAGFGLVLLIGLLVGLAAWAPDAKAPPSTTVPVPTLPGGDLRPRGYYTWCDGRDKIFNWQSNLFVVPNHPDCDG